MVCLYFDRRTVLLAICLGFVYLATIFVIVGLTTNHWVDLRDRNLYHEDIAVHFGLHRICWVSSDRCNNPGNDYDQQNSLPAVQGLVITGGFVAVAACLMCLANLYLDLLGKSKGVLSAAAAAVCCIAGGFVMVGIILFGVKVEVRTEYLSIGHVDYLGYSFGLTTTASIMFIIGAILSGVSGLSEAQPRFNF